VALFQRLHRALRLTEAGLRLHRAAGEVLQRLHAVTGELRQSQRQKAVIVTTTPGFAGLWLIPRLPGFTARRPDVDVRISAGYELANLNRDGVDLAIRYTDAEQAGASAQRLFGDVVFPVCSPKLVRDPARPLKQPQDLRLHTLLLQQESGAGDQLHDWTMWLHAMKLDGLKPASTLRFSMYDQLIQAALCGQGIALGRSPLIDDLLRQRKLVKPFATTIVSPRSYHLLQAGAAARKSEVQEFVAWLREEIEREIAPAANAPRSGGSIAAATARGPGSRARAGRAPT
jgi:DNA-binding transcriptional LysR family regulator